MAGARVGPEFGAALRAARQERGLSLRGLAERIGVSPATLSQIETGKSLARPARAVALAEALGLDPEALAPGMTSSAEALPATLTDWRSFAPLRLDPALRAALECFTATGYHGASVRDIAKRCGLSVPGLYHYYPSKQAMLAALFELGMTELRARSEAALAEGTTTVERFCLLVEALTLFHAHRPELSFLGTSEMRALPPEDRRRHAGIRTRQQQLVDDEVQAGVREGVFRTPEPKAASRAAVSMCVAVAGWYRAGGRHTPEDVARQYVRFCLGVVECVPGALRG